MKRARYTHDPNTNERVTQYSPIGPFYANDLPDYRKSGYRHSRSSIQVGPSADHLHVVEEWGRPIVPYGEWRYPYRPYSAPYSAWGPPYGGLNIGFGYPYAYPYSTPYATGGGWGPGDFGGYGRPYSGPNWTNPFGGPPGVDEYYPDAPAPSQIHPRQLGPRPDRFGF